MTQVPSAVYFRDVAEAEKKEGKLVYQVLNLDREEMFFGVTDFDIDATVGAVAKINGGPAAGWKSGELVQWRPLTDILPDKQAMALADELQGKTPPNKFKVLPFAKYTEQS